MGWLSCHRRCDARRHAALVAQWLPAERPVSRTDELVSPYQAERHSERRDRVTMRERLNVQIRGVVQGVFFRDTVRQIAERHNVDGFVRNVGSDILEIEAEGERDAVQAFIEDVRKNPPRFARVDDVRVKSVTPTEEEAGFYVDRTAR